MNHRWCSYTKKFNKKLLSKFNSNPQSWPKGGIIRILRKIDHKFNFKLSFLAYDDGSHFLLRFFPQDSFVGQFPSGMIEELEKAISAEINPMSLVRPRGRSTARVPTQTIQDSRKTRTVANCARSCWLCNWSF